MATNQRCWQPPETGRDKELENLNGVRPCPHPDFSPMTDFSEMINFYWFKPPSLWFLLEQPQETNTGSEIES